MNYKELLQAYRKLWSNRALPVEDHEYETLQKAIKKELMDEMTHPRTRKNPHQKFHLAVKRILSSELNDEQKISLINMHLQVFEELN